MECVCFYKLHSKNNQITWGQPFVKPGIFLKAIQCKELPGSSFGQMEALSPVVKADGGGGEAVVFQCPF